MSYRLGCEPSACGMGFGPAIGKSIARAGDVDGDGCADYFSSRWVISGKDGRTILETEGSALDSTNDCDGDGLPDWLIVHDADHVARLAVHSSRNGRELLGQEGVHAGNLVGCVASAGDVDRDGCTDVLLAEREDGGVLVRLVDGANGSTVLEWRQVDESREGLQVGSAGDMDGDGTTDYLTSTRSLAGSVLVTVRSGRNGSELFRIQTDRRHFGNHAAALGDLDGDGRGELLISDYEACVDGTKCAGAVYVISFRGD
jgi:hypothetical protein